MDYVKRTAESKLIRMNTFFKAILVTGARQVGKTTLLRHLSKDRQMAYVTLDDTLARNLAQSDPALFFQTYKPPVIIDEVQYAPSLFGQIKLLSDKSEETGMFWLTGSQRFDMMKNIRETLAGRIGILELYSLSKNEKDGVYFDNDLDFSFDCLRRRWGMVNKNDIVSVFEHIWRGGMPQLREAEAELRYEYLNAYTQTYLMRDAAELGGVTDSLRFAKFLTACAGLISQQVNYKTLADTCDISQPTAKAWLRLLEGMGVVYLLRPYANNQLKRLAKTPKLYFCDTGLAAHLSMWLTRDTLMNGAASGHYFENYVVIETLKNYAYASGNARLSYYRDANAKEIDLCVERDNKIHPLEIKKSAAPDARAVKKFNVFKMTGAKQGEGGIICVCEDVVPIDSMNCFIPCVLV